MLLLSNILLFFPQTVLPKTLNFWFYTHFFLEISGKLSFQGSCLSGSSGLHIQFGQYAARFRAAMPDKDEYGRQSAPGMRTQNACGSLMKSERK